ncbi:MAG: extracellular solute-binding protein [Eubacteriales bacterium]|nr:extracellular solute-binding protein [Eubacteriales bacterium]
MRKRTVSLLLGMLLMGSSILSGCGGNSEQNAADPSETVEVSESADEPEIAAALEYYGNDVSQEKELVVYVIGDEPVAADSVEEALNERLKEVLNTTVDVNYISLSDYAQKYSLLLASGESIDLIYTSTWAFYNEEATKGAFIEITDELREQYMPQTYEEQDAMAFEQAKIQGKCYMVPKNSPYVNNAMPVLIRGDLREKYGMDPIDSVEDLQAYFEAVVENEEGIYPYAASADGVEMSMNLFQSRNNLVPMSCGSGKYFGYFYEGENPTAEDVVWQYGTQEYLEFCTMMKEWADKGFWSKNAVSNTTSPMDAFQNGTSAALFWNLDTCESAKNVVDTEHPEWKAELVNVTPGVVHVKGVYTGDGFAVPAVSENQERALVLLDILKFDKESYDICRYGIEGATYNATSDTTYTLGADQANYTVGNAPLSWGLKNDQLERIQGEAGTTQSAIRSELMDDAISEVTSGFIFDDSSVKSELAAMSEVCSQYVPLLELGLVDDVQGTLDELNAKCDTAGRAVVEEEFLRQYTEYLENLK